MHLRPSRSIQEISVNFTHQSLDGSLVHSIHSLALSPRSLQFSFAPLTSFKSLQVRRISRFSWIQPLRSTFPSASTAAHLMYSAHSLRIHFRAFLVRFLRIDLLLTPIVRRASPQLDRFRQVIYTLTCIAMLVQSALSFDPRHLPNSLAYFLFVCYLPSLLPFP